MPRFLLFTAAIIFFMASTAHASDWPAWRGPTGQGFSDEKNLPVKWNATTNVKWKIALADAGNSTPVIWKDKIFLTQANKGGTVRSILCYARADGKLLWQKDVEYNDKEQNWRDISYTNASAVVDADCVIACYASAGLYGYDHAGKELWKRTDLGKWQHKFGSGSSPILHGDLAYMWCGPNEGSGRNFLLAVNKMTGKTVWEHDEKVGSWSTPLVTKIDGQDQLLLTVVPYLKAFDPKTGKELWSCKGLSKNAYPSPLVGNGIAVAMSGFYGDAFAVKLGGAGDITKDRLWQQFEKPDKIPQRVGTGMIVGAHVYMVEETGTPRCYDLTTGKELWEVVKRPAGDKTWGSMVHADGRLYILMRSGETLVLAASPKYEHIATNDLGKGEQSNSSIAISDGEIFIRTFRSLWCISEKK